jgi:hypothetical protein
VRSKAKPEKPSPPKILYPECKKPTGRKFKGLMMRSLLVTLHPAGWIELQEGRGTSYSLPLMTVYRIAIEAERSSKKRKRA